MCKKTLGAWSTWDQNQTDPNARLAAAAAEFEKAWNRADTRAAKKDVNCAETTLSATEMELLIDTAVGEIVAEINTGLDLGDKRHAKCGGKLLKAAAYKCDKFLKAESKFVKAPGRDPEGAELAAQQAKASEKFSKAWDKETSKGKCPTAATKEGVEGLIDALSADVVFNSTVSPNVPDDAFMAITHPAGGDPDNPVSYERDTLVPQCQDGSAFTFFAKRGTENKLLMYYYGGGACWDTLTCGLPTCTQTAGSTPPGLTGSGFADLTDPDNPFKDWHVIQVPYCGCDIHLGDNAVDWVNVEASPFNVLFPGDPQPGSLPTAPFELSDPNDPNSPVVINCGP
jgi:hypothetical protein